ncbi:MAG: hypothetical protein AB1640_02165 [bacterium]
MRTIRTWLVSLFVSLTLVAAPVSSAFAQDASSPPPVAQPLVREGDLAVKLVAALNLGQTSNEAEAESALTRAGIAPSNGWIADYPVTPDVISELLQGVRAAAASGKIGLSEADAMNTFNGVTADLGLAIAPAQEGAQQAESSAPPPPPPSEPLYTSPTTVNNYYYEYGPPVVTYYPPPPYYSYLYAWVPFPFFSFGFWFPGYYCLNDFDRVVYVGHHARYVSNHWYDPHRRGYVRVEPPYYHRHDPYHRERYAGTEHGSSSSSRYADRDARELRDRIEREGRSRSGPQEVRAQRRTGKDQAAVERGSRPATPGRAGSKSQELTRPRPSRAAEGYARNPAGALQPSANARNPVSRSYGTMSRNQPDRPAAAPYRGRSSSAIDSPARPVSPPAREAPGQRFSRDGAGRPSGQARVEQPAVIYRGRVASSADRAAVVVRTNPPAFRPRVSAVPPRSATVSPGRGDARQQSPAVGTLRSYGRSTTAGPSFSRPSAIAPRSFSAPSFSRSPAPQPRFFSGGGPRSSAPRLSAPPASGGRSALGAFQGGGASMRGGGFSGRR